MIHEDVSQGTPRSKWAVITVVVFATHALIASITVVVLALIHLHNVDSAELVGERGVGEGLLGIGWGLGLGQLPDLYHFSAITGSCQLLPF